MEGLILYSWPGPIISAHVVNWYTCSIPTLEHLYTVLREVSRVFWDYQTRMQSLQIATCLKGVEQAIMQNRPVHVLQRMFTVIVRTCAGALI